MQRELSFNICSVIILAVLIFSLFSRKMVKGRSNLAFFGIAWVSLFASLSDIFRWIVPISDSPSNLKLGFTLFWDYVYFLSRNLLSSTFMFYIFIISGVWYKLSKNKKRKIIPFILPALVVITVLSNLFTGNIFYHDADLTYHRGKHIFFMYGYSLIGFVISIVVLIKQRKLFKSVDYYTLLCISPAILIGVFFQMYKPFYLVENITTTFVIFAISLVIHRPEENINVATGTLGINAYIAELERDYKMGIPDTLIFIHIDNYKQLKRQFSVRNYKELLRQMVVNMAELEPAVDLYDLDNCIFVVNCHSFSMERVRETSEKIKDYLNSVVYKKMKVSLVTTICVVKCPEELTSMDKVISFSNNFFRTIEKKNVVTYLGEESTTDYFKIRTELDDIIKKAIERNNFEMYYQPIYSVDKKKFCSAEALIRLKDDEYGFISPGLFIPAAEASGAIHQIGDFVIEDVCRFIATHNIDKLGLDYIELNLSVAQCIEKNFAEKLIGILEKNHVDKSKINLEITETAADYDIESTNRNINVLSQYGLTFSLDDYGTGYSNIKRVTTMPLSIIKLDKTFVDEYQKNEMKTVIKHTVDMFKKMDKHILVEGVEDKVASEHFINIGCNYIQGYYYSKPLPEKDFVKFIRERNKRDREHV